MLDVEQEWDLKLYNEKVPQHRNSGVTSEMKQFIMDILQ